MERMEGLEKISVGLIARFSMAPHDPHGETISERPPYFFLRLYRSL